MRRTILSLFVLLTCVPLAAQQTVNSGPIDKFNTISLTGNIIAKIIPSDVNSVDVFITDADIKNLKWGVTNGALSITFRQPSSKLGRAEMIIQYTDTLKSVSISNGELSFDNPLTGDLLTISVKGGGVLNGYVDVLDLMVDVTGNSAALLSGTARYVTLRTTEKSKVDMREVDALSIVADAATGSEAFVKTNERLVANAKTGATIFYQGTPLIVRDRSSKLDTSVGASVINVGK